MIRIQSNFFANTFSHMGCKEDLNFTTVGKSTNDGDAKNTISYTHFHSILDDLDIAECVMSLSNEEWYLNLPNFSAVDR